MSGDPLDDWLTELLTVQPDATAVRKRVQPQPVLKPSFPQMPRAERIPSVGRRIARGVSDLVRSEVQADATGTGGNRPTPRPTIGPRTSPIPAELTQVQPPKPKNAVQRALTSTSPAGMLSDFNPITGAARAGAATREALTNRQYGLVPLMALGALPGGRRASKAAAQVVRAAPDPKAVQSAVESLKAKYGPQMEHLWMHERDGEIVLDNIIVPKAKRGQGLGSEFMEELTRIGDDLGTRVRLTPDASQGATSVGRLKKFYGRFGFVPNAGRNKDFAISESMFRHPSAPKVGSPAQVPTSSAAPTPTPSAAREADRVIPVAERAANSGAGADPLAVPVGRTSGYSDLPPAKITRAQWDQIRANADVMQFDESSRFVAVTQNGKSVWRAVEVVDPQ